MRSHSLWAGVSAITITSLATSGTLGAPKETFPLQKDLCVVGSTGDAIIDKKKLAEFLVKKFRVGIGALSQPSPSGLSNLPPSIRVIADPQFCANAKVCEPEDITSLQGIKGSLSSLLSGIIPGYRPTAAVSPETYVQGPNEANQIVCEKANGVPIEAPGSTFVPPPKSTSKLRIRGKVNDLVVDRSQQKEFQGASAATASISDDSIAKKTTETIQGTVGYAVETDLFGDKYNRLELIPYVNVGRSVVTVRPGSTAKPSAKQFYSFGLLGNAFVITSYDDTPVGHLLEFRPDFLFDESDNSSILSANLRYTPVLNGYLNDYVRILPDRDDFASIKPILDFRANLGTYTEVGTNASAASDPDYLRLGGQIGFTLISDYSAVPLTFTSTYTWLAGLVGQADIDYFSNALTLNLDPNKYFGITLNYNKGTREDTAKDEDLWTLGLSGKF